MEYTSEEPHKECPEQPLYLETQRCNVEENVKVKEEKLEEDAPSESKIHQTIRKPGKRLQKRLPDATKKKIILEYFENNGSKSGTAKKYNLPESTLRGWLKGPLGKEIEAACARNGVLRRSDELRERRSNGG